MRITPVHYSDNKKKDYSWLLILIVLGMAAAPYWIEELFK